MAKKLEDFPKDVLFRLGLELNLPDLLHFCDSNPRIDRLVCQQNDIWYLKLNREFPNYQMLKPNLKDNYRLLYELTILKEKLNLKKDIYEIYNLQRLNLGFNQIEKLPKEIGNLTNLQKLYLNSNKIKEIPKEIGNLTNLEILNLGNNQIEEIPKEIGNLTNLKILYLSNNQIEEIPKEIGNLTNLQELFLISNNQIQIKDIPKEITNLPNLQIY